MQLDNSVKPDDDNSMSELKQILSEALMKKGIFGKIQAELRASIFSIFKEKELKLSFMSQIQRVNDIKSTLEGKLMFNLILDVFDILGLTFSKSVLLSEASLLDIALPQNALRNQLNLEGEGEKNTPVLLQLLKTLSVQDINLEEYIMNEKHSKVDSFEAFKQKLLDNSNNENASSSNNSERIPIIMTSEMKTNKTIDDFKNRNNDILKKLDSIINIDKTSNSSSDEYLENNDDKIEDEEKQKINDYEQGYDNEEDDEFIEEVSLLDIQNNSLISDDEILKESKIIEEAEAAAKSSLNNSSNTNKNNEENNEPISTTMTETLFDNENKYKAEEDSEIEFITEVSKEGEGEGEINDESESLDPTELDSELLQSQTQPQIQIEEEKEELSSSSHSQQTLMNQLPSEYDNPSEIRKLAAKSLIDDIKHQLENEDKKDKEDKEDNEVNEKKLDEDSKQISIDDININSKNIR